MEPWYLFRGLQLGAVAERKGLHSRKPFSLKFGGSSLQITAAVLVICIIAPALARNKTCACGRTKEESQARIVGGEEAVANGYPWAVAVFELGAAWAQFCGGSVITPRHVLTAGHCAFGREPEALAVLAGHHDLGEWRKKGNDSDLILISNTTIHERYLDDILLNDIALLLTSTRIENSPTVGPVCLPPGKMALNDQRIKVLGWGLTKDSGRPSDQLREVDVTVMPLLECKKFWPGTLGRRQLCTHEKDKDSCNQDSGGPLVWLNPASGRYTLVALVSYGETCAGPKPAVNADVSAYVEWITDHVKGAEPVVNTCSDFLLKTSSNNTI